MFVVVAALHSLSSSSLRVDADQLSMTAQCLTISLPPQLYIYIESTSLSYSNYRWAINKHRRIGSESSRHLINEMHEASAAEASHFFHPSFDRHHVMIIARHIPSNYSVFYLFFVWICMRTTSDAIGPLNLSIWSIQHKDHGWQHYYHR